MIDEDSIKSVKDFVTIFEINKENAIKTKTETTTKINKILLNKL